MAGKTKFFVHGPSSAVRFLQSGQAPLFEVPATPQQLPYFFFRLPEGEELDITLIRKWVPKNRPLIQGQSVGPVR